MALILSHLDRLPFIAVELHGRSQWPKFFSRCGFFVPQTAREKRRKAARGCLLPKNREKHGKASWMVCMGFLDFEKAKVTFSIQM